jgi:hypothetical protein
MSEGIGTGGTTMSGAAVVVRGVVKSDGTLEVSEKLDLPAGQVRVTVQPLGESPQSGRFWAMMESIWSDLQAGGRKPRTREEIDAEINALREEAEEEMRAVERLHEESRRAGGEASEGPGQ